MASKYLIEGQNQEVGCHTQASWPWGTLPGKAGPLSELHQIYPTPSLPQERVKRARPWPQQPQGKKLKPKFGYDKWWCISEASETPDLEICPPKKLLKTTDLSFHGFHGPFTSKCGIFTSISRIFTVIFFVGDLSRFSRSTHVKMCSFHVHFTRFHGDLFYHPIEIW